MLFSFAISILNFDANERLVEDDLILSSSPSYHSSS
ncbi:hypothetical protein BVRB_8g199910 isoform A [Beta vulgaris subsp. vulgaris]|uniref:Uncharacterized protein n=1 Tax=Beta vulgaris subsp. vulgaris TaxID=3555 RepID=A0A0J8B6B9_BETVV|nr:hypothetical protein BVRB_8g199910 isoform A [Beta vulgaris subsp. vulgaris]